MFFDPKTLYHIPHGVKTRWASPENWDAAAGAGGTENSGRKGSPFFYLPAGAQRVLAEVTGQTGTLRRIWITISDRSPKMLRGVRLDIYWDGASEPAVSAPLGDFFGHGLGRMRPFQSCLFSSPEGRSFLSIVPMPFKTGMRAVVTNESGTDLTLFYYDVDFTVGDGHPAHTPYFHAHFNRENPTTLKRDFDILPRVAGAGRYLGAQIGVIVNRQRYAATWWGEGEVKIYLDGDRQLPTLCGTGTEDYIGTAFGQGRFDHLFQGCPLADEKNMQYSFYRLHVPDPVYFAKDIRVTLQQMGIWEPHTKGGLIESSPKVFRAGPGMEEVDLRELGDDWPIGYFERADDVSSCVYFYLDRPTNGLGPITPAPERMKGLVEDTDMKTHEGI
ncbi:MAG: DUF2961 domain-containing protein [Deltaproteobacteria bacterium]|nr:DUF2961 domain-containing protein [Candidatus Zymogenaceae bacterium]